MRTRHFSLTTRPRVGIFIEENLIIGARKSGLYLDFRRLTDVARGIGVMVHASAHISYSPTGPIDGATRRLGMALRHSGFTVDVKPRSMTSNGREKSRVDNDISFAIARVAIQKDLDVVILGSGDGDFVNVLGELNAMGLRTLVVAPGKRRTSPELLMAATTFLDIAELAEVPAYAA